MCVREKSICYISVRNANKAISARPRSVRVSNEHSLGYESVIKSESLYGCMTLTYEVQPNFPIFKSSSLSNLKSLAHH